MIRGIGPICGKRLVRAFGEAVFDVIEERPERLRQVDGREAKTIHRLLEIDPRHGSLRRNEENPLGCDLLVVDETSTPMRINPTTWLHA